MHSNQIKQDLEHLRFHRCFDEGEAYSGAVLVTREHFLSIKPEPDLSDTHLTIETASFQFMETRKLTKLIPELENGAVIQTLDVLDFSVVHLSAYERSLRHHKMSDQSGPAIERMHMLSKTFELLGKAVYEHHQNSSRAASDSKFADFSSASFIKVKTRNNPDSIEDPIDMNLAQTLVLLPWAGSTRGVGNSRIASRVQYLRACFWSFYARYGSNIVIGVPSEEDAAQIKSMQLPAMDVWVLKHVELLPLALLAEARRRLRVHPQAYRQFKYIFFSESDQLLVMRNGYRNSNEIYSLLRKYPRRVLVPHRLMPYAHELLRSRFNTDVTSGPKYSIATELKQSKAEEEIGLQCCLERQNCENRGRSHWLPLGHARVRFVQIEGLMVAMGNSNFRQGTFRPCALEAWSPHSICA